LNSEPDHIEIKSEEISEILGRPPGWMSRWGINLLFIFVCLFLVLAWFVKYPDTIIAVITVSNERPPATMVSKVQGKITRLSVKDGQKVLKGQLMTIIENPARYEDVLRVKSLLKSIDNKGLENQDLEINIFPEGLILGGIQPAWNELLKSRNELRQYHDYNVNLQRISSLQQEMKMTNQYYERLYNQKLLLDKDLKLGRQQFVRDSLLHQQKVISSADFEKSEAIYLQKKFALEGARVNLASTKIKVTQLEQEILDLKIADEGQKKQLRESMLISYGNLLNQIETWEQNYLLISPVDGKVTLTQFWSINQNVKPGDKILTVVPDQQSIPMGRISMSVLGAGKVRTGQRVNIKFANYPYLEYGIVMGKVKSISLVPNDNQYSVEVILPDGMKTNYGKYLPVSQEIQGTAEIITDDISILQRLINPLKYLFKKNLQ
jgi:multidrug resistance efflux pump